MPGYYDDALGDEDEEARYHSSRRRARSAGNTNMVNRILVIVTLVILVMVSIYFQSSQMKLTQQIGMDEETIQKLQEKIQGQGVVINRFNSSVTNSDVVKRLATLEYNLGAATKDLHDELDKTVHDMNVKLNQTMITLQQTVARAEQDITSSVQQVKKDYEEFERKTNDQFSMENSFMIWQLAGTFTLISCLIRYAI
jgi:hypothetical protein